MVEAKKKKHSPDSTWLCCLLEMEDKDTLRQQVVESTKLLLKAVDRLESTCKEGRSGNHSISSAFPVPCTSASQTQASAQTSAQTSASKLEMSKLFNWSSGSNVRKRKKTPSKTTSGSESKKKKLQHVFCCLASTTQQ